jgi:hypothetical protein
MHPKTRHTKLLENTKIRRWYENIEVRSTVTAGVYLRNLGLWLEYLKIDPDTLIELAKDNFEEFKGRVADQIRKMEREGIQGASISTNIKPMISFLKFYNVVVKLNLNIKNENRNLNAEKEVVPEKYQLRAVLLKASKRERVAISLMAFSGLRPISLGNELGIDGLRLGDIPDLTGNGDIDFIKIPARINIRAELSKTRLPYFTFLGQEGCQYILDYLRDRKNKGEVLNVNSPVILPINEKSMREDPSEFLRTNLIERRIKKAITKAEFNWRPYIFRAYFGTNLDTAEAKGLISHPQRQFIMGHKGDIEETYTKRGSDVKMEEIRSAYAKCLPFLETENKTAQVQIQDLEKTFTEKFLKLLGFSDTEIKDMADLDDVELQKRINERRGMSLNSGHKQKVISMGDVEKFIIEGWEYVNSLPGDKAIIKLPDH